MKRAFAAAIVSLMTLSTARADDPLIGKSVIIGDAGAPFCAEKDNLQEYIMAMLQKDEKWMNSIDNCASFKAGLKVAVIEEYPGSDLGHVVKVRVFGNGGSAVGYMLSLGLVAK